MGGPQGATLQHQVNAVLKTGSGTYCELVTCKEGSSISAQGDDIEVVELEIFRIKGTHFASQYILTFTNHAVHFSCIDLGRERDYTDAIVNPPSFICARSLTSGNTSSDKAIHTLGQ